MELLFKIIFALLACLHFWDSLSERSMQMQTSFVTLCGVLLSAAMCITQPMDAQGIICTGYTVSCRRRYNTKYKTRKLSCLPGETKHVITESRDWTWSEAKCVPPVGFLSIMLVIFAYIRMYECTGCSDTFAPYPQQSWAVTYSLT